MVRWEHAFAYVYTYAHTQRNTVCSRRLYAEPTVYDWFRFLVYTKSVIPSIYDGTVCLHAPPGARIDCRRARPHTGTATSTFYKLIERARWRPALRDQHDQRDRVVAHLQRLPAPRRHARRAWAERNCAHLVRACFAARPTTPASCESSFLYAHEDVRDVHGIGDALAQCPAKERGTGQQRGDAKGKRQGGYNTAA